MIVWVLLVATQLFVGCGGLSEKTTIVAVYGGRDSASNSSCINGSDYQYRPDEIPQNFSNNLEVRLCSNQILLGKVITISNVTNVTVVGYDNAVLKCPDGASAGLSFLEIHNLTLSSFKIENCGLLLENQQKTSVNVRGCTNVRVTRVNVTDGLGMGLALFRVNGTVEIADSSFQGNGRDGKYGGSGIHLEWNDTYNDDSTSLITEVMIKRCKLLNNTAKTNGFSGFNKGGGGVCIYVINSSDIRLTISNSTFIGNEVSTYGGGIFASFSEDCRNSLVTVDASYFIHNKAKYGGAMHAEYVDTGPGGRRKQTETPRNNSFTFISNHYNHNHAVFGGGVSVFSTRSIHIDTEARVIFDNCTLKNNVAQYGSAVAILPNAKNSFSQGYLPKPVFKDCTIDSNVVMESKLPFARSYSNQHVRGDGAVYCFGHSLVFQNENKFLHNKGSSMYLGYSSVTFAQNSVTNFTNNSAYDGGAVHMLVSVMYIDMDTRVYFTRNRAHGKGGAIYQESPEIHAVDYSQTCFINFVQSQKVPHENNISVVFKNNQAGNNLTNYSGHSIFTTSLLPCCRQFQNCDHLSKLIFNTQAGHLSFIPRNRSNEIMTDINHAEFEDRNTLQSIAFIPGKERTLSHTNLDDLNQTTSASYMVTISHSHGSNVNTSSEFSQISGNTLKLYGNASDIANVSLSSTSSRKIVLSFEAKMQPCPPGYIRHSDENTNLMSCICSVDTESRYKGIVKCNSTLMQAYRNPNYWIGYDRNVNESEDSLWSGHCPNNFCSFGKGTLLPETADRTLLCGTACSGNRTGILCGRCESGTSVHYHSLKMNCEFNSYCHLGWLFYILSEIVPVTIIFLIILLFNIPFTSGIVNSFIFFSQVLIIPRFKADGFPQIAHTFIRISRLAYLFFNLDVFVLDEISYCLWKNATALDILSFSYITMTYSFLLIIIVIYIRSKYNVICTCSCQALTRSANPKRFTLQGNIIHGLSSFLVLFSSHCVKISIMVLTKTDIYSKGVQSHRQVVHYNGEIEWMSRKHLPYAIPAIIMLFSVLIPSVLLMVYPVHYRILSALKISESRYTRTIFSPLERLKPFFDSFQGCFKDNYRFFSGLYFMYRYLFLMIVIWMAMDDAYFVVSILLGIILITHSVLQPYRERLHNTVDVLLLGNLTLINLMTAYNVSKADTTGSISSATATITLWVQLILIHVPLFCVLVYFGKKTYMSIFRKAVCDDESNQEDDETSVVIERMDYGTF